MLRYGWVDFEDNNVKQVKSVGGMTAIVRSTYGRNLFRIMREFGLTPASPDFYNMSPEQLDFMVLSLQQDNKEIELARTGKEETSFVNDEDFNWEGEADYGGEKDDSDEIARILGKAAMEKRDELFDNAMEMVEEKKNQSQALTKQFSNPKFPNYEEDDEVDTL